MFVAVNQMTGRPVSAEVARAAVEAAEKLGSLSSDELQLTSQELGFGKTKLVVAELLHGLLSEEVVAQALDLLQSEYDRMAAASRVVPPSEPFL